MNLFEYNIMIRHTTKLATQYTILIVMYFAKSGNNLLIVFMVVNKKVLVL